MSAETINITPRRLEDAPRPVATEAGWNWPLLMGTARGIGAALLVWGTLWFARALMLDANGVDMPRDRYTTSAIIAALGAFLLVAFRGRSTRLP
jgi:hypothetical protein